MKTIYRVQNVIAVVALTMAMYLANRVEITTNESLSAIIMIILTVVMLLGRSIKHELNKKEDYHDWNRKNI